MKIWHNLRELREEKGISQYKMSKALGLSPQTYWYYEKNSVQRPWAKLDLHVAAKTLDCDVDDILSYSLDHGEE